MFVGQLQRICFMLEDGHGTVHLKELGKFFLWDSWSRRSILEHLGPWVFNFSDEFRIPRLGEKIHQGVGRRKHSFPTHLPGVHFVSKLLYTRGSGCRGDWVDACTRNGGNRRLDVKRWNWVTLGCSVEIQDAGLIPSPLPGSYSPDVHSKVTSGC